MKEVSTLSLRFTQLGQWLEKEDCPAGVMRTLVHLCLKVIITYITCHRGIPYHERAKRMAGEAEALQLVRTPSDILGDFETCLREHEMENRQQFWLTQRLMDNGWTYGEAPMSL